MLGVILHKNVFYVLHSFIKIDNINGYSVKYYISPTRKNDGI